MRRARILTVLVALAGVGCLGCIGIAGTRGTVARAAGGEPDAALSHGWWRQFGESRGVSVPLPGGIELYAVVRTREEFSVLTIGPFVPVIPWPPGMASFARAAAPSEFVLRLEFRPARRTVHLSEEMIVLRRSDGEYRALSVVQDPGRASPSGLQVQARQGFTVSFSALIESDADFSITIDGARSGDIELRIPVLHFKRSRSWRFIPFNA
jgi:hypothetical protein